jgi:hypothetical protein
VLLKSEFVVWAMSLVEDGFVMARVSRSVVLQAGNVENLVGA